jgi:hypothetical protein
VLPAASSAVTTNVSLPGDEVSTALPFGGLQDTPVQV